MCPSHFSINIHLPHGLFYEHLGILYYGFNFNSIVHPNARMNAEGKRLCTVVKPRSLVMEEGPQDRLHWNLAATDRDPAVLYGP